jgi:hypothetical protein
VGGQPSADHKEPLPVRQPGVVLADAGRRSRRRPVAGPTVRIAQPEPDLVLRLLDGLRRL